MNSALLVCPLYTSSRGKGRKFMGGVGARGRALRHREVETFSPSNMQPFTLTTHTTGAHPLVIAAAGSKGGRSGRRAAYSTLILRVSLLARCRVNRFLRVCQSSQACFVCAVPPRCMLPEVWERAGTHTNRPPFPASQYLVSGHAGVSLLLDSCA